MQTTQYEDLNCAVDLNLFELDYDKYHDSQLYFEADNQVESEEEEPYSAY